MSQTLDANLNIISQDSAIEIQRIDGDLNIIQKLDDEPNDVGGLTAAQLKAKFDEAGNIIKDYINETLIPAILEDDATEAGRTAAENERRANEQERVSNENDRVTAEKGRVEAEKSRAAAEEIRANNETRRENLETGYVTQAETAAKKASESANAAAIAARTYPQIKDRTWWVYDVEAGTYVDTGVAAQDTANAVKFINGMAPDENGNVNVAMVVTVTNNTASQTAAEICAHVQGGGTVVLMDGDVIYNFSGWNPSIVDGDEPNVAFLSINGADDDFQLAYITGRQVTYYRFNPLNKIDAPVTAKAGQALVVKSVDELGVPTEWEVADVGKILIVTVTGGKASHTALQIAAHVQAGGTVVLMMGNDAGNFITYNEDDGTAVFFWLYMDAIWSCTIDSSGNVDKYVLYEDINYVKTVNGIEPDENGNVEVAGGGSAGLVVTVTGGKASHTALQIAAHVQAGGTVVLKWSGGDVYGLESYDADENTATFVNSKWFGDIERYVVDGAGGVRELFKYNPSFFVETVNGIEPDENGNVEVSGGGLAFSKDILPETHYAEEGNGYVWDLDGLIVELETPIVAGKTYIVTIDGVSYEGVAVADPMGEEPDWVEITLGDDDGYVSYSPIYFAAYGDYNAAIGDFLNWETDGDGLFIPRSTTVSITQKGATPGDVVVVKSVDENGNPTELESSDLVLPGRDVFSETYFETADGDGWNWDSTDSFWFNLSEALVEGQAYTVTIDGNTCAVTAVKDEDLAGVETYIYLEVSGIGRVIYFGSDADFPGYNARFMPYYWETDDAFYIFQPFTLGIKTQKYVNPKYIDIAALKAALGL